MGIDGLRERTGDGSSGGAVSIFRGAVQIGRELGSSRPTPNVRGHFTDNSQATDVSEWATTTYFR